MTEIEKTEKMTQLHEENIQGKEQGCLTKSQILEQQIKIAIETNLSLPYRFCRLI